MKGEPKRPLFRWFLAVAFIGIFLLIVPATIRRYAQTSQYFNSNPKVIIKNAKYNDLTDGAIQASLNLSNNLFQIAVLVMAALAGLMIAKDGEAGFVLSNAQEVIMSICASLVLLLSIIFNLLYVNEISYIYAIAGKLHVESMPSVPDVFDENIRFLFYYQFTYLLTGTTLAFITFISAHKIKGGFVENEND